MKQKTKNTNCLYWSILVLLFVIISHFSYAQLPPDTDTFPDGETTLVNFYIEKARSQAYFDALANEIGEENLDEEGTGYNNFLLWVKEWEPLVYPHGDMRIALAARDTIIKLRKIREAHNSGFEERSAFDWIEVGPYDTPVEAEPNSIYDYRGWGTGRVQFISFDPQTNENGYHTIFTGSPKGGLYYSDDNGETWYNGGTDRLPIIGVSHLQVDPGNSSRWYLATGDGDGNTNEALQSWNLSNGIYRTTDAGANWTQIGDETELNATSDWQIKKLLVNPNDGNILYAATSSGIYKTSNATSANPTWTRILQGTYSSFYDIEFKADNSGGGVLCNPCSTLYATESKIYANNPTPSVAIYKSTDSGVNWSALTGITIANNVERIAIEVTKDNPDIFYAVFTGPSYSAKLYKYTISTQTWTDRGTISGNVDRSRAQSIGVSPIDDNLIFIGNVSPIKKSTDGGATSFVSVATEGYHDDQHSVKFSLDGNTLWAATDGGIFKSTDAGASWTPKNNGIGTATILGIGSSDTDENLVLTGMFDCGTNLYDGDLTGNKWRHALFGDGLEGQLIDYTNSDYMYTKLNSNRLLRSDDRGQSFDVIDNCGGSIFGDAEIVFNVVNPHTIYYKGWNICRTTNQGDDINNISDFSSISPNYIGWEVYTAPSNQDFLYAVVLDYGATSNEYRIYKTENANAANPTWSEITGQLTDQYISDIGVDYNDPKIIYVTYAGVGVGEEKVCKYNGNTSSWTDLTVDLNDAVSVTTIVLEKGSNGGIYLGTNGGIYYTNNEYIEWSPGAIWGPYDEDLPYVEITELEINYKANKLWGATNGRGLWESARLYCNWFGTGIYSGAQTTMFYEHQTITSSATIASGNTVTYRAETEIALTDGFGAASGAEFAAFIHPCEGGTNSFKTDNNVQSPSYETNQEEEKWESEILIYPNPNKGQFTLSLGEQDADIQALLLIRDIAGREISQISLSKSQTLLDLTEEKAGIYFLEVIFPDGKTERAKVVKE